MKLTTLRTIFLLFLLSWSVSSAFTQEKIDFFQIRVIDEETDRGVPLIELETVNNIRYVTDSNGIVAFYEPGLMHQTVFFSVSGHGYEYPKDGFGMTGVRLETIPGGSAEIRIRRKNIAERMYRITGAGIYRDSILTGAEVPIQQPVLNGGVLGQDSAMAVIYKGDILWLWGDTSRASYPLGNFHMSGATSALPIHGGLPPETGIDLNYFVDENGFSRAMAPMSEEGVVWLDGIINLKNADGEEQLYAHYSRLRGLGEPLEHGLMRFDEEKQIFTKWKQLEMENQWRHPRGHVLQIDGEADYLYFMNPYPNVRVRAAEESLADPNAYEGFTCLASGLIFSVTQAKLHRDKEGNLIYQWRNNVAPIGPREEQELIKAGLIKPEEARFLPRDVDSGKVVVMHTGTVNWNEYRQKWILIAEEIGGEPSFLGEIWYSESDSATGPWLKAKKIITHDNYTFYNPVHHPFYDQQGGRFIYFQGTYSKMFSDAPVATPRYDYNQIMYRLDLSDPGLQLPE
ncbi:MAG: hypothetical protein ACOX5R_13785 [bacterium]|jgi:hypothetical protein